MTNTNEVAKEAAKTEPTRYNLKGKIVSFRDSVRQKGATVGTADMLVRVETTLHGKPRVQTVKIYAGKPLQALREKIVAGAIVNFFGVFEQVPANGEYKNGGQVFRAFSEGRAVAAAAA